MEEKKMSTIKQWLCGHYLTILLVLAIAGIVPAMTPAVLTAVDLFMENGRLKGRAEILNLPRARHETVIASLDEFRQSWHVQKPETDLISAFNSQRWANMRINMAEKYINEQNQSAGSPYEIDYVDNLKIRDMIKDLRQESGAYYAAVTSGHAEADIKAAKQAYDEERRFLDQHESVSYWPALWWLILGYLKFVGWSGIYFVPKLKRNGFKFLLEVRPDRLPLAMVFCPIMFKIYPWGEPKDQLRQFLRSVASMAAFCMCNVIPATATFAKNAGAGQRRKIQPVVLMWQQSTADKPAGLSVDPPKESPKIVWSFSTIWLPKYDGLAGGDFSDYGVVQSNVSASLPSGLSFGLWFSKSTVSLGKDMNYGNEVLISADYTKKWQGFSFSTGLSYDNPSPVLTVGNGDVLQTRASLGRAFNFNHRLQTFTPHVLVRHFNPVKGSVPGRGTFIQSGFDHTVKFHGHEVDSTAEVVTDTGAFGFTKRQVLRWTTDFNWKTGLGKLRVQIPAIRFTAPLTRDPVRVPQLLVGVGASW
jgi:hypothetical protein